MMKKPKNSCSFWAQCQNLREGMREDIGKPSHNSRYGSDKTDILSSGVTNREENMTKRSI